MKQTSAYVIETFLYRFFFSPCFFFFLFVVVVLKTEAECFDGEFSFKSKVKFALANISPSKFVMKN